MAHVTLESFLLGKVVGLDVTLMVTLCPTTSVQRFHSLIQMADKRALGRVGTGILSSHVASCSESHGAWGTWSRQKVARLRNTEMPRHYVIFRQHLKVKPRAFFCCC